MGILRRLYEGFKFMAVASDIPFIRNSADRKTAERFLRIKSYRQAFNLYRMTEQHAKNNNLIFDELVSLLRQRDILDDYSTDDKETAQIYGRLSEIEHLLDNSVDSWDKSITVAYNYTPSSSLDESVVSDIMDEYYKWFLEQSKKNTSVLRYKEAIICAKAARRFCTMFRSLSYDKEIESLFSLGVIYGNIRNSGMALHCYSDAIHIAKVHEDNGYLIIALYRKLTFLLAVSHIDTYLDYDKERDSVLSLLLELVGDGSTEDLGEKLFEAKHFNNGKGQEERIGKIEEAIANLELLLSLRCGDMESAHQCVEKIKAAEMKAYGTVGHADALIEYYQMLFSSPERTTANNQQDEQPSEDPHYVPDIPSDYTLSFRYAELVKWMTNCTVNHWHASAQDSGSCLFALGTEAASDYHICMANYMIARDLAHSGKEDEALQLYKETFSILIQANGHPESDADLSPYLYYAICMSAGDILLQKNPSEAINYYEKAISYLGMENSNHRLLEVFLKTSRAMALDAIGRKDGAEKEFEWCLSALTEAAISRLPYLTGDERESLWESILHAIKRILANLRPDSSANFRRAAYNAVLFSKGFLLTTEKSIQKVVSESDMQRALELYRVSVKQNIQVGTWGTSHIFSPNQYVDKYLNDIRLQLEIKDALSELSIGQHDSFECISSSLNPGMVIVDYFDTVTGIQDKNPKYLAFIVKPGLDAPDVIDVFSEEMLSVIFSQMKSEGDEKESALYDSRKPYGGCLFNTIWKPISVQLHGCDTVYLCASGSLNKIAIECLPYDNVILADSYIKFYRVSHARAVLSLTNGSFEGSDTAVFIGGLAYDADSPESSKQEDNNHESRGNYIVNSTTEDADATLCQWKYLPWTAREVEMCKLLWERTLGKKVSIFKGHDGTIQVFEGLAKSKTGILHVATHGFSETKQTAQGIPALSDTFNPLQLTGLILSDGNRGWIHGNKSNHPGVLTAYDISSLNLQGVSLVVLSACFTGGGIVRDDGLYGLIRAFKKAGVKSVIASLWEQSDQVAYLFMYYYYLSFLGGADLRDAFKDARNRVRKDYPDPIYWAGYIFID